jgi:hypothetical protein
MAPMEVEKAAEPEHEMVDLGLSVMWATCNVGADKPEEYGDYFAWGETEPKTNYTWETYKFRVSGDSVDNVIFNKYCSRGNWWGGTGPMDNKTVLDPEDDAAHVNWGGSWRMPTLSECEELLDNCTWEWTSQNGVNGRKVTGPSGKSIFLPAAGLRDGTVLVYVGSDGYYRSSPLATSYPYFAYHVYFYSGKCACNWGDRFLGFSVRPVSD